MNSGIYKIVNRLNGKFYLGSSGDFERRKCEHFKYLRENKHINRYLQFAFNKYGEENFYFEKFIKTDDLRNLKNIEQQCLDELEPWKNEIGYNLSKFASGGDLLSYHPDLKEIKEKIGKASKQRWNLLSEKEKEARKSNLIGEKNPNWRGGTSKAKCIDCGVKISPYRKRCNTCCKLGDKNPFYGKTHSKEFKKRASETKKGKNRINKQCKRVLANGEVFESGALAAEKLKISRCLINYRIRKNYDGYKWL